MNRPVVHWRFVAVLCLALAAIAWVLRDEPPASWLRVEGPRAFRPGAAVSVSITLLGPQEAGFLMCDIHAGNPADRTLRVVASSTPQAIVSGKIHYSFPLVIPDMAGLTDAHYVIYRGPTARWADHREVVTSKRHPISAAPLADIAPVPVPVFTQVHDPGKVVPDHRIMRWLTSLAWMGCAALAAQRLRRRTDRALALIWITLFFALAVWELTTAGPRLADLARSLARGADVYEGRRGWQQVVTAAAIALAAAFLAFALGRPRTGMPFPVVAGLALFVIVSLATMLSLHEVDHLLAETVLGIPWAAVLRFGAGACALAGSFAHAGVMDRP